MRGKVLGGSSSINVMAFTRGHPGDYDRWAQKGALGWSYADVLPYFKRCESWQDGENEWRGGVRAGRRRMGEDARSAVRRLDRGRARRPAIRQPRTTTARQPEGFGRSQYSIRNGRRSSAATAYLKPALARPNLTVEVGAHATRVADAAARARPASNMCRTARCGAPRPPAR